MVIPHSERSLMTTATSTLPHSRIEDGLALIVGSALIAFGLLLAKQAGIATGGTAGVALYIHYALGYAFGPTFFLVNMPFYYLAVRRMSWSFSLKTFAAIVIVSLMSTHSQDFITLERIDTWYASLIGNMLMGIGYLVLFRHRASLGGFGILMLYLQDKFGWRAGWLQMGTDVIIVCISLTLLTIPVWVFSVIGAVTLNIIVALNHRADRYLA